MKLGLKTTDSFFDLLNRHVDVVRRSAEELHQLFLTFDRLPARLETLQSLSAEGRDCMQEMTANLGKAFVTPIDREDLHLLASSLQRVLGYVRGTAGKLPVYRVDKPSPMATQQAQVLVRITGVLVKGFDGFSRFEEVTELWQEVKDLEREGDRLLAIAIAELFNGSTPVIEVIKWKEIHEDIETAIDRAEDVFDALETALVKHA
ncbi:MAG TPA: DUF47 family protein [Candidatus Xenobia bacterium]|jgi:hypothetical protein